MATATICSKEPLMMRAAAPMPVTAKATRGVPLLLTTTAFLVKKPSRPMANSMRGAIRGWH